MAFPHNFTIEQLCVLYLVTIKSFLYYLRGPHLKETVYTLSRKGSSLFSTAHMTGAGPGFL